MAHHVKRLPSWAPTGLALLLLAVTLDLTLTLGPGSRGLKVCLSLRIKLTLSRRLHCASARPARLRDRHGVLAVVREHRGAPCRPLDRVLELAHLPQQRRPRPQQRPAAWHLHNNERFRDVLSS